MSFFARLKAIFSARASQALDDLEDPRASLDYSLTRLQASLRQISDSLVEVSTARRNVKRPSPNTKPRPATPLP